MGKGPQETNLKIILDVLDYNSCGTNEEYSEVQQERVHFTQIYFIEYFYPIFLHKTCSNIR